MNNITKPKRGDCGTCHWFEQWPGAPDPGTPSQGSCVANPPAPIAHPVQIKQPAIVDPTKQQPPAFTLQVQGIVPPTNELRRCSQWRPAGTQPPFDDMIRPGTSRRERETDYETKQ